MKRALLVYQGCNIYWFFLVLNKIVTSSIWVVFIFCRPSKPFGGLINFWLYESSKINAEVLPLAYVVSLLKTTRWHHCFGLIHRFMCMIIIIIIYVCMYGFMTKISYKIAIKK